MIAPSFPARRVFALLAVVVLFAGLASGVQSGTLENCVLFNEEVAFADIRNCLVVGTTVTHANLRDVRVVGGSLEHTVVQGATLEDTTIEDSFVTQALLTGVDVTGATLTHVQIMDSTLRFAFVSHAALAGTTLENTTLQDSTIDEETFEASRSDVTLCRVAVVDAGGNKAREDVVSGCHEPAWPREGSFVRYVVHSESGPKDQPTLYDTLVELTFEDGAWVGECTGTQENHPGNRDVVQETIDETVGFAPPRLPVPTVLGIQATSDDAGPPAALVRCAQTALPGLVVTEQTTLFRAGDPAPVAVWRADNPEPHDCASHAWFDTRLGLVLSWRTRCDSTSFASVGRVVASDAPLS